MFRNIKSQKLPQHLLTVSFLIPSKRQLFKNIALQKFPNAAHRWRCHWKFFNSILYVRTELNSCSEAIPARFLNVFLTIYNIFTLSCFSEKISPIAPILVISTLNCIFIYLYEAFSCSPHFCSRPISGLDWVGMGWKSRC